MMVYILLTKDIRWALYKAGKHTGKCTSRHAELHRQYIRLHCGELHGGLLLSPDFLELLPHAIEGEAEGCECCREAVGLCAVFWTTLENDC